MPGFKDFVNLTALAESDLDDYLAKQVNMKFASAAARTAALTGFFREGIHSYLDDLNTIGINTGATDVHSTIGPVHGALTAWTPAIVQLGSVTCTVTYAVYQRLGRGVHFSFNLSVTGAGTASNTITVTLPVTAASSSQHTTLGSGYIYDNSGNAIYPAQAMISTTTTMKFLAPYGATFGHLGSSTFTGALASSDIITASGWYEAASDA